MIPLEFMCLILLSEGEILEDEDEKYLRMMRIGKWQVR